MTIPMTCAYCLQPLVVQEIAWLPYCEYEEPLCDGCYLIHVQTAEDRAHDARTGHHDPEPAPAQRP